MRAIASGRKYRLEPRVTRQLVLSGRGALDDPLDDRVGRHALALGRKANHDTVPEHRCRERLNVFGSDVGTALLQQRLDGVFFTGSHATGVRIAQAVASKLLKLQLELQARLELRSKGKRMPRLHIKPVLKV